MLFRTRAPLQAVCLAFFIMVNQGLKMRDAFRPARVPRCRWLAPLEGARPLVLSGHVGSTRLNPLLAGHAIESLRAMVVNLALLPSSG